MKRFICLFILLFGPGAALNAAVLQDWSTVSKESTGTYADDKGTQVTLQQAAGPTSKEKAVQIACKTVEWGGMWAVAQADLTNAGSLKFQAKGSAPGLLQVALTDDKKTQVVAMVRVSDAWDGFSIPLTAFRPTKYPVPEAPKGAALRMGHIQTVQFQPQGQGSITFWVGPVESSGDRTSQTGWKERPGVVVVQDFLLLGKNAYGTFADKDSGTSLAFSVEKDPEHKGGMLANCLVDQKACGWCGAWMRAGDTWGGQDWRGAKTLSVEVNTREPLQLEVGFNDANQNAYTASLPMSKGQGWETLQIPFTAITLNPYWQPPEARKGAPQDLSHIETLNLSPKTPGKKAFQVREITIKK